MASYLPNLAFQPYVTSYAGNANKELGELGTTLNQRYDDNIANYDKLDEYINQINVRDVDAPLKEALKSDTRKAISSIATNGDWENAKTPLRQVARRLANDDIITTAQKNAVASQELDKQRLQAAIQGKPLIQFKDYSNVATVDPQTGRPKLLDTSGVYEGKLDTLQKMREIFADVQADSHAYKSSTPTRDEATGQIYQVGSGSSARYLSKDKIKEVANRSFNDFLNTAEGQQRLKVLTTTNSENPTPVDIESAKKRIKDELVSVGLNKTFADTASESSQKLAPGQGGKPLQPAEEPQLEQTQISGSVANPVLTSLADKLKFKNRGGFVNPGVPAGPGGGFVYHNEGTKYGDLSGVEKKTLDKLAITLGIKKGSNEQYSTKDLAVIQKFANDRANTGVSSTYRAFTDDEINKAKNYVANGNYAGRSFFDKAENKFVPYEQLPDDVKKTLASGETKGIQFSGVYDTDNPFYDLAKQDPLFKGKDVKQFVSPENLTIAGRQYVVGSSLSDKNKTDIDFRELETKISRANRSGVPVTLKTPDGGIRHIVPIDNGLYRIVDNKGNSISNKAFTKEQLAMYARDAKMDIEND